MEILFAVLLLMFFLLLEIKKRKDTPYKDYASGKDKMDPRD